MPICCSCCISIASAAGDFFAMGSICCIWNPASPAAPPGPIAPRVIPVRSWSRFCCSAATRPCEPANVFHALAPEAVVTSVSALAIAAIAGGGASFIPPCETVVGVPPSIPNRVAMPAGPPDMICVMESMAWLTLDRDCIAGDDMICCAPTAALNAPPLRVIGPIADT